MNDVNKGLTTGKSRQRIRSERAALDFFDRHSKGRPSRRVEARKRIRQASRPLLEAKGLIAAQAQRSDRQDKGGISAELVKVDPVTWKLTDGVVAPTEGRLDPPTTRARAWISGLGWSKDGKRRSGPSSFIAYRRMAVSHSGAMGDIYEIPEDETDGYVVWSFPAATLAEAKEAGLAMLQGQDGFAAFVAGCRDGSLIDEVKPAAAGKVDSDPADDPDCPEYDEDSDPAEIAISRLVA